MLPEIDLRQVRFYLENARQQLRNVYSKHGTNGKDALQQALAEALKELSKGQAHSGSQESAIPAG